MTISACFLASVLFAHPVVINEIMYNPAEPTVAEVAAGHDSKEDFEFIEICNVGLEPVTFVEEAFTDGIRFHFADGRAPNLAFVHVRKEGFDAVAPGVPAQGVQGIEAHGLVVEEGHVVLHRVVVAEPGRLIRQQAEGGGVGLGEAELAEGRDLLEEHLLQVGCSPR